MKLKQLFDSWGESAQSEYQDKQWLLSKWEVFEGIEWPEEKTRLLVETLRDGLKPESNHSFIELGCGGGWLAKEMSAFVKSAYGLDFSEEMLKFAKSTLNPHHLICAEIGKIPVCSNTFDRILSYYVFMNFDDDAYVKKALHEIVRILKTDGIALIGQLPAKGGSQDYEKARDEYFEYWQSKIDLGKSIREDFKPPLRLFDKQEVTSYFKDLNVEIEFKHSFNPFYREGSPPLANFRYDLIIKKL